MKKNAVVFITRKKPGPTSHKGEYQQLKPAVGNALPTISISTINTDANSKPQREKYRVCVLGNIDPTNCSLNVVFAPVLSQLELRLFTIIAV